MNVAANLSLRFAQASDSKAETTDRLLKRQTLQSIAIRVSLVGEAIDFSILGILILVNRHQAELIGFSAGSSIALVGGSSTILVGVPCSSPLVSICGPARDVEFYILQRQASRNNRTAFPHTSYRFPGSVV
jgi:hypothetical protein